MKQILTILAVIVSISATAQLSKSEKYVVELMGIPIQGDFEQAKQKFIEKGFKESYKGGKATQLTGKLMNKDVNLYLLSTPKTNQLYKAAIFFDKKTSWTSIKSEFNEFEEILTKKYGKPSDTFKFFEYPFKEYDGYETTAVKTDKCTYMTFWKEEKSFDNAGYIIAVQINDDMNILLQYENTTMMEVNQKEQDEINQKTF